VVYPNGRTKEWVKVTCQQRETLPIAGFALKEKRFDRLYLGGRKGKQLIYAGKVDHGFDSASTKGSSGAAQAADPEDAALQQKDRAPRGLGRTVGVG
jgi:ATP-dependent DNA ligase